MDSKRFFNTILLFCCFSTTVFAQNISQQVYLIANCGEITEESQTWKQFQVDLSKDQSPRTVLVLGDFIQRDPRGKEPLPPALQSLYQKTNKDKSINWYFLTGDQDWNNSGELGIHYIKALEDFFRDKMKDKDAFQPRRSCPDPELIELDKNTVLVLVNSQWFMHPYTRPELPETKCKVISELDFWDELEETLDEAKGKNIIIAAHHPVYSTGQYAGKRLDRFHLIPVGGTIYKAFREQVGRSVDMANTKYKAFSRNMRQLLREYPSAIYVSGHEYDLQAHYLENHYHLNSGAIHRAKKTGKGKHQILAHDKPGYFRLDYFEDGHITLNITRIKNKEVINQDRVLFTVAERQKDSTPLNLSQHPYIIPIDPDHPIDTVLVAGEEYAARSFQKKIMGENYRPEWTAPIRVPYLRIDTLYGGLIPIGKGGGLQTNSLKFNSPDGREFAFRQVNKDPVKALDPLMKQTIYKLIVKDLIVTQHPYGGLVAAHLMDTTDILYSKPILGVMPDAAYLGPYREEFRHQLGTLEFRPKTPKRKGQKLDFGGATEIHSSNKMFREYYKDNDNQIDAKSYAQARMFDLFVGDWDRHEDNWKWAAYKEGDGFIYRPIPRDRDHVFSQWGGILPGIADKVVPNAENFGFEFDNMVQLSFKGRHLDRQLAVSLSREDWEEAAKYIQSRMSDHRIDQAVKQLPKEIYNEAALEIAAKLKSRRTQLVKAANELYELLAEQVTVVGSNKREIFDVKGFPNGEVSVKVYDRKHKSGNRGDLIYERLFFPKETKEIQLFGLGGKDEFYYTGARVDKTKIRVIGGAQRDSIVDSSTRNGGKKEWLIYDTKREDAITQGPSTNYRRPKNEPVYNNKAFEYNAPMPLPAFRISSGNGFGFELRYTLLARGFNKPIYKSKYQGKLIYYPGLRAHRLDLRYWYRYLVGLTDFHASLRWSSLYDKFPFFYNIGNRNVRNRRLFDTDYYRTDFNTSQLFLGFQKEFLERSKFTYGLRWDRNNVTPLNRQFSIFNETENQSINGLELQNHIGITTELKLDFRDNPKFSQNGALLYAYNQIFRNLTLDNYFGRFDGHIAYYATLLNRITFALRTGGSKSYGKVPFYQLSPLGSNSYLRGYVRNRFLGRGSVFLDTDLRFHIGTWRTLLAPIKYGIFIFHDTGRVWSDQNNEPNTWHYGYGGGIFAAPFNENFNLVFTYARNREERAYFSFRIGFRLQ